MSAIVCFRDILMFSFKILLITTHYYFVKKQNNIFIGVKDLIATIYETKSRFIYLFLSFFVASFFVVMDFTIAICFD